VRFFVELALAHRHGTVAAVVAELDEAIAEAEAPASAS